MMRPMEAGRPFLLALVVFHAVTLTGVAAVRWSGDLRSRFLPDDPAAEAMELESALFGDENAFFILAERGEPLVGTELGDSLASWREELRRIPSIARVWTPYDLPALERDADGDLRIVPVGSTRDPLSTLARHPLAASMLRRDGRGVVLTIVPDKAATATLAGRRALVRAVEDWARGAGGGSYRLAVAGALPFEVSCLELAFNEARWITGLVVVVAIVILAVAFRSLAGALAILAVGAINVASTFGLAGHLAGQLSQFNLYVIPVVLTISLLDNVHITHAFCRAREGGSPAGESAAAAARAMAFPCVMTSVTTAAGFSVLLSSHLPQIRQFGALAAVGTLIALSSSLIFMPLALSWIDPRRPAATRRLEGALFRISPRVVLASAVVVTAVVAPGAVRLHLAADYPRLLVDDHPWTVEMDRIEQEWGGIGRVSFLLGKRAEEPAEDIDVLEWLDNFSRLLRARPLVTSMTNPVDVLRYVRKVARRGSDGSDERNDPAALVKGLVSNENSEQLDEALVPWISRNNEWIRIVARIRVMHPEKFPPLLGDLEGFRKTLAEIFDVRLSGWALLYKNLETELLTEMARSFTLAFVLVGLLIVFVARSFAWWLIALAVNLFPLWVVLGVLGWSGHGFSSGLLLAPGMALGLVVDDTIHVLYACRRATTLFPADQALRTAIDRTFLPVTLTSILLVIGLAVMSLSVFRTNRDFGLVMAAVVFLAWTADVLILPALARSVVFSRTARGTLDDA